MKKPDYEGFALAICQCAFDGCGAEGDTIQELGLEYGVLRTEDFDIKKHKNVMNAEYFEPGDTVYCFIRSSARQALKGGDNG